MTYLLDTHTFLWFSSGSSELTPETRLTIADKENRILLSIASLWEISIKTALGKLEIVGDYESVIDDVTSNKIEILPVTFAHTVRQNRLPFYHRDPFDRMIISQAMVEGVDIISKDETLDIYLVGTQFKRIW